AGRRPAVPAGDRPARTPRRPGGLPHPRRPAGQARRVLDAGRPRLHQPDLPERVDGADPVQRRGPGPGGRPDPRGRLAHHHAHPRRGDMTSVHQVRRTGRPDPSPGHAPPARRTAGLRRPAPSGPPSRLGRLLPRTVAARVRTLTAVAIVLLVALLAVTWAAIADAREGVRVIGHDAGPQVVATGDLYFQLTDMDAQLANALLAGGAAGGGVREQALERYDDNRQK